MRKSVEVGIFRRGWVTLSADFRQKGCHPPTTVGVRKLERLCFCVVSFVWYQNICSALFGFVTKHMCDKQTGRQNYDCQDRTTIAARVRGKNVRNPSKQLSNQSTVLFLFLLGWPPRQRLVWLSTASAEATFGPMHNPVCVLECLYVWVVCGYCHTDSACLVSVRALYCIFIVPSLAASFSRYQACVPMPDRHRVTQAHRHPSKVIASWCYGDPTRWTPPRTYLLSDSQHPLQLRHSIPECRSLKRTQADPLYLSEKLIS